MTIRRLEVFYTRVLYVLAIIAEFLLIGLGMACWMLGATEAKQDCMIAFLSIEALRHNVKDLLE